MPAVTNNSNVDLLFCFFILKQSVYKWCQCRAATINDNCPNDN